MNKKERGPLSLGKLLADFGSCYTAFQWVIDRMLSIVSPYVLDGRGLRYLRLLFSSGAILLLIMSIPAGLMAEEGLKTHQTLYATISSASDADRFRFTLNIGSGISFLSPSPETNPLLVKTRVDRIVETVKSLLDCTRRRSASPSPCAKQGQRLPSPTRRWACWMPRRLLSTPTDHEPSSSQSMISRTVFSPTRSLMRSSVTILSCRHPHECRKSWRSM
jgi:hypothetical protein